MATVWRWPPESDAMVMRTDGILADSCRSSSQERFSISTSSERASGRVLLAEVEVGDDVEVVAEGEVLEDRRDAEVLGLLRAVDGDRLAVEDHLALVGGVDTGHDLDERRLAGTVVAHEGHDLTRVHVDRDVLERLHGAESLADARHREHGGCCCGSHGQTLEPFGVRVWKERDRGSPCPAPHLIQLTPASLQASA